LEWRVEHGTSVVFNAQQPDGVRIRGKQSLRDGFVMPPKQAALFKDAHRSSCGRHGSI
jgi:hypothetical protein